MIKTIQKETESAKNLAILSPTPQNVANYLQQQKKLFSITDKFTNTWKQVLWANPDLGYAREIPVSAIGRQLHKEQQYKATKVTLHQLSKRWGLLFFYSPKCPHCHKFAPILRRFVDEYGFELLALSPDGSSLPQMPDTKQDNGLLEKFGVTSLPQVIVMDAKTKKPVGRIQGMVTEDVLIEQLLSINNEVNREP